MDTRTYDAIVVGAGNGGLVAAAQLAVKGVKVLLLEQHNLPGGFASSFVRGRFEFETSLHELGGVGSKEKPGRIGELFNEIGVDVEWMKLPEAYRIVLTNLDEDVNISMPFGAENFIEAMEKEVPGTREVMTKYLALCSEVMEALTYLGASKGNPDKKVLTSKFANFLKTTPYSVAQVAKTMKIPEKAQKILHAYWCYLGPELDRLNFTVWAAMLNRYMTDDGYIPRYRSNEMSAAIESRIREKGGEIEFNTRVENILTENGKVVGVKIDTGEIINSKHVIANVSPTLVYNKLISSKKDIPEICFKECNARVHGTATFVVYLGLDTTVEELGITDYSYFIFPDMDTKKMYDGFDKLDAPDWQATVFLDKAIPDTSPPGASTVFITTLFQPDSWKDVKPEEYFELKQKIADGLITKLEKALNISIRDHIEEIEIATPQTTARYTGTHNGIVYAYEPESWDSLIPRMMMMKDDKHFEGLEICGGFSFLSHGYGSSLSTGKLTALMTYRDMQENK